MKNKLNSFLLNLKLRKQHILVKWITVMFFPSFIFWYKTAVKQFERNRWLDTIVFNFITADIPLDALCVKRYVNCFWSVLYWVLTLLKASTVLTTVWERQMLPSQKSTCYVLFDVLKKNFSQCYYCALLNAELTYCVLAVTEKNTVLDVVITTIRVFPQNPSDS